MQPGVGPAVPWWPLLLELPAHADEGTQRRGVVKRDRLVVDVEQVLDAAEELRAMADVPLREHVDQRVAGESSRPTRCNDVGPLRADAKMLPTGCLTLAEASVAAKAATARRSWRPVGSCSVRLPASSVPPEHAAVDSSRPWLCRCARCSQKRFVAKSYWNSLARGWRTCWPQHPSDVNVLKAEFGGARVLRLQPGLP